MANEMIKFFRGLEASLPAAGVNGGLYITTDEGAIYLGTGAGMKRLGDFVQVANVAALPAKAHESCLYYCVAENILAKWNGAEWKQVNKQPTTEELKTLLGLGTLAYKSEVAETDLNTELAKKINDASAANHGHENKTVIDGITAEKVAAWDASEQNAKDYADGLDKAMNTRVEALEAIDHEHANKALLDTYTQTEADLADAVAKKHAHTFVEAELNKIADGDVAKWNAAEQNAKDYADGLAEAIQNGETVNDFAGTEAELAKKVEKVEGKSLILDTEIARLADMSDGANKVEASETNGNIKIDGEEVVVYTHPEKHAIADVTGLQDALDGLQAKGDYAAEEHTHTKDEITDFAHTHVAADITDLDATIKGYDYATKTELGDVDKKFADYKTAADQKVIDDEQDRRLGVLEGASATHATKDELNGVDAKFADYTKTADLPTDLGDFTNNAGYAKTADVNTELDKKADKSVVDAMYTNGQIDTAVQGAKDYAKGLVDAIPAQTDYTVTITETTDGLDSSIAKKYTFTQNGAEIGTINLAKELVVTAGSVKEVTEADAPYSGAKVGDKYIELVIANQEAPIYVPAKDLVDIYTAKADAAEVQVAISNTNEISATLVNGGITEEKLAEGVKTKLNKVWEEVGVAAGLVSALENGQVKTNKEAIEAINNAETGILKQSKDYADGLNTAMNTRVVKLEAIDHDAYIAADTTLKGEIIGTAEDASTADTINGAKKYAEEKATAAKDAAIADAVTKYETIGTAQGIVDALKLSETYEPIGAETRAIAAAKTETENQVKALAEGAVATNAGNIETLFEMFQWGEF